MVDHASSSSFSSLAGANKLRLLRRQLRRQSVIRARRRPYSWL